MKQNKKRKENMADVLNMCCCVSAAFYVWRTVDGDSCTPAGVWERSDAAHQLLIQVSGYRLCVCLTFVTQFSGEIFSQPQ